MNPAGYSDRRWVAWLMLPMAACLLVYRDALRTWFFQDDFAWLGLRLEVNGPGDLLNVLFRPEAQGTVRVLSERAFFLIFSSLFGLDAAPFRICIFATQFANIVLLGLITRRITGSRVAAVTAALIWTLNAALTVPLAWISAYNEVLWTCCLLAAFYCFLRYLESGRRRALVWTWVVYLLGFGVLELNVLFPALILLYSLCCARAHWRKTVPFFVPALIYTIIHFTIIPKVHDPLYTMYLDREIFRTFGRYVQWTVGPAGLPAAALAAGIAVGVFVFFRIRRRDWRVAFLIGWFLMIIGPVLPLKNHVSEYYLTVPAVGFSMLAGWAFASAARRHWSLALLSGVLVGVYAWGMYREIEPVLDWRAHISRRLRTLMAGVEESLHRHPANVLFLGGVDSDLFVAGLNDQPFRLLGVTRAYLVPGSEQVLGNLRGLDNYVVSPGDFARVMQAGEGIVLFATDRGVRNSTKQYRIIANAQRTRPAPKRIDIGLPGSAEELGPTWFAAENGFRWMPRSATVRVAAPEKTGQRLRIDGFAPAVVFGNGPVVLAVQASGIPLGSTRLEKPDQRFSLLLPLPDRLIGKPSMDVELSVDRTYASPDGRQLGMTFGVVELR